MNTEEDEFKRIEAEAKRRAAVEDDDDTQTYTSESAEEYLYRFGYEDGAVAEREACAKLCELMWHEWLDSPEENEPNKPDAEDCYRAIRARGKA